MNNTVAPSLRGGATWRALTRIPAAQGRGVGAHSRYVAGRWRTFPLRGGALTRFPATWRGVDAHSRYVAGVDAHSRHVGTGLPDFSNTRNC